MNEQRKKKVVSKNDQVNIETPAIIIQCKDAVV